MLRRSSLLGTEERRGLTLAQADLQVREGENGEKRFVGHASVFDVRTAIGNPLTWGFYEECAPGMFTKTLSEGDARFLIDHDSYYVVSRVSADTLNLAQDKRGLAVDSALDEELSYVRDLKANLSNGNITGMSFGFYVIKDDWSTETVELSDGNSAEVEVRRLLEVKLIEVSAVTFPAYEETDAGLRHSLIPALRHRGDPGAVERLARHRPELAELLEDVRTSEPAETTPPEDRTNDDEHQEDEPAASTREDLSPSIEARMRALTARYRLPVA